MFNRLKIRVLLTLGVSLCAVPLAAHGQGSSPHENQVDPPPSAAAPVDPVHSTTKPKSATDPSLDGYTIGEQDVLDIDVWKEKEISETVVVRPDGKIAIPLVNEIYVLGMTPLQLQSALTDRLAPFVTAPEVTVSVREINSRKVYLMGQVNHPGVFHINSTTTVYQILAQAGGLRDFAKRKKIYVLRKVEGKDVRLPFNYDAFIKGQPNGQDVVLLPGDSIVVP